MILDRRQRKIVKRRQLFDAQLDRMGVEVCYPDVVKAYRKYLIVDLLRENVLGAFLFLLFNSTMIIVSLGLISSVWIVKVFCCVYLFFGLGFNILFVRKGTPLYNYLKARKLCPYCEPSYRSFNAFTNRMKKEYEEYQKILIRKDEELRGMLTLEEETDND